MQQQDDRPADEGYPLGRGYGHDYMRGGEVLGGYGYSERPEYARRRGEDEATDEEPQDSGARRRADDA
ncbi:MAG TPA: hypothetical protein VEZ47_00125 [Gemmatirosa sp.]|nr:hypothetical protein [Gemmatirosa sp.]